MTHTRKAGDPNAYAFFPPDIERACNPDLEPTYWFGRPTEGE